MLLEEIDTERLRHIIDNHEKYDFGSAYVNGKNSDKKGQLTLLTNYLNEFDNTDHVEMPYSQVKPFRQYFTGKSMGIQNMSHKIRHTICKDLMYDIDMKNAHPTLLSHFCHVNNITCKYLDSYIQNRGKALEVHMKCFSTDRDEAKKDLLAIINGRLVNRGKLGKSPWYRGYYRKMRLIQKTVSELNNNFLEMEKKYQGEKHHNLYSTTINYLMCDLENQALMTIYDELKQNNIEPAMLVFDGIMICKQDVSNEYLTTLMKKCEDAIRRKLCCKIELVEKEMNEGYEIEVTTDYKKFNRKRETQIFDKCSKFNLELLSDLIMLLMFKRGI